METIATNLLTEASIKDYMSTTNMAKYEVGILNEILDLLKKNDSKRIDWFASFGEDVRHIIMNVYAYRRGLDFGFTEIKFDQYGWFIRPQFLDFEAIKLGDTKNYNSYSEIRIGRGPNHVWTYALSCSFGTAGSSCNISVYDPHFKDRASALNSALSELNDVMQAKVGNSDRSNYNPQIIASTLKAVSEYKYKDSQMTLF